MAKLARAKTERVEKAVKALMEAERQIRELQASLHRMEESPDKDGIQRADVADKLSRLQLKFNDLVVDFNTKANSGGRTRRHRRKHRKTRTTRARRHR